MVYELPIDLYKDWKDLTYTKELFENIVKELKKKNTESGGHGPPPARQRISETMLSTA